MKKQIQELIANSLKTLESEEIIPAIEQPKITIENSRDSAHGDFASNIAMVLAKVAKTNPRGLAEKIIKYLPKSDIVERTEIAGPGFINFFLKQNTHQSIIIDILEKGDQYGDSSIGNNIATLVEFVSANPTGPLHIGHGRGAAYGAVVANLLKKVSYKVSCEYYVNDAGRQMDILAVSVWLRYLQINNKNIPFPDNAYQGDYINDIADSLQKTHAEKFITTTENLFPLFAEEDPELKIDGLIGYCKDELGQENYRIVFDEGLNVILATIKNDLNNFGVEFDTWFSERSLVDDNTVSKCIEKLTNNNWIYEKDGAQWFRSSKLGDEKDRVLIRENGLATYFASDIAYHLSKVERGFEKIIDIWGADHHGYITRVKASMQAMELSPEKLEVLLVQFATLYRGKEKLQMSTRSGQFITLKELQDEVGKDATRFFYIMRKSEQHLDFDMELAKSQSNDNPVYYIQYAHARICSVFRQMPEKGFTYNQEEALSDLSVLTETHEIKLLSTLARYPEVIENAALAYEPHQLVYYLKDVANDFHTYYNASQFLIEDNVIRNARLALVVATKQVIKNGLSLLGVSSPEVM
ncbi:MAG TPA: arginine--tRNA ligase [Thiotrichaceae bacterium]|nr:arginine--tRNA ligase [Thiotrichaceae bacterium]HIM08951.1 arginine--tRNA ligase [Gammaproteobacteria bacterium]